MAKQKEEEKVSSEVAVSNSMFAADAGAGMEGAEQESFAIPFLAVLQKGSPQVDETSGASIEGARAGMFFENVTGRMFDGKDGVRIVPCAYKRAFLRWGPRGTEGAGFKGELAPEGVAAMRARGEIAELDGRLYAPLPDGTVNPKRCDRFSDTRAHYVLLIDELSGGWTTALMSLSSTQIKKSKQLMSALASVKVQGPTGKFTPATFANYVRATSVPESNEHGSWYGVKFTLEGSVDRFEIYQAAKAFHDSVVKGEVTAKYDASAADDAAQSEGAATGHGGGNF